MWFVLVCGWCRLGSLGFLLFVLFLYTINGFAFSKASVIFVIIKKCMPVFVKLIVVLVLVVCYSCCCM